MPFKKLQEISGVINSVNDGARAVRNVTSTANNVQRTGQDAQRTVSNFKNKREDKKAKKAAAGMWVCDCGEQNSTKFCGACGSAPPVPVVCPKCKWKRPADKSSMKFCGECGTKFEED